MRQLRDRVRQLLAWARRAWTSPQDELTRWQRAIRYAVDLSVYCARELRKDRADQMAAALTYHTLFSLLPTAALVLVVASAFVGPAEIAELKETVTAWALEPLRQASAAAGAEAATARVEFEQARHALDERVRELFAVLERVDLASIGIFGVLLFLYGATGLLQTTERSFNTVYGVERQRPWYRRVPLYYTALTLSPLVIVGGRRAMRSIAELVQTTGWLAWLGGPNRVLLPLLTTWLALFFLYLTMPNTPVRRRAAAVGSFVAAALWLAAIELFGVYVGRAALSTLYGALALVPLFLLWVYLSWLLVLFGLELAYALQTLPRGSVDDGATKRLRAGLADPAWLVPVAAALARAFRRGEARSAAALAGELDLPQPAVEAMVRALQADGLVHRVEDREELTLSRPAEAIPVRRLLDLAATLAPPPPGHDPADRAWALAGEVRRAPGLDVDARTLADLTA